MRIYERFTVQERAARYQRRYTGPWKTAEHQIGPVVYQHRYRRRLRADAAEMNVALHDAFTHALWREGLVPLVRPIVRWLARHLPAW